MKNSEDEALTVCVCVCAPLSERRLPAQEAQLLLQTTNSEGQIARGQDQQEDAGRQTNKRPLTHESWGSITSVKEDFTLEPFRKFKIIFIRTETL